MRRSRLSGPWLKWNSWWKSWARLGDALAPFREVVELVDGGGDGGDDRAADGDFGEKVAESFKLLSTS